MQQIGIISIKVNNHTYHVVCQTTPMIMTNEMFELKLKK
jgi:hypothetical protein